MTKKKGTPPKRKAKATSKAKPSGTPPKRKAKATSKAKPSGTPPKRTQTKALPPGKRPKAPKGRRQSTKKAEAKGSKTPPPPPVVDPRIVALRQVADWILRGENEISIQEAIKATFPEEDAIELLAGAFLYIGELAGADPALRRTWHIAARRELYRRTVEIHDFNTARAILRDLGQLEGLYPKMAPTKTKPKTDAPELPADAGADDQAPALDPSDDYPVVQ